MINGTYISTPDIFRAYIKGNVADIFPKSLGMRIVNCDKNEQETLFDVALSAMKNNPKNETGKKRIARFMQEVERLGINLAEARCANSVDWKTLID